MLAFIAILFILSVACAIGWRVGRNVPDEVEFGGEYLHLGLDVLLMLIIAMTLYGFGYLFAALFVIVLVFARKLFPYISMPVVGIALALTTFHAQQVQIIIFTLALLLNFLFGVTMEDRVGILKRGLWQPGIALALFILLRLLPSKPF